MLFYDEIRFIYSFKPVFAHVLLKKASVSDSRFFSVNIYFNSSDLECPMEPGIEL